MPATRVPEGLAAMPPGPALAAVLGGIELGRVPNDRMLEVLKAQHRQLNHEQARMAATMVEIGRCDAVAAPGVVTRLPQPGRYAAEETRAALYWTRNAAECEHGFAETVVHSMLAVFTAWRAGDLDRARVRVFERYLTGLAPELVARVCAVAVPIAPGRTTGQLAYLLHRTPRTERSRSARTGCPRTRPRPRACGSNTSPAPRNSPGTRAGSGRSAATCSSGSSTAASPA